MVDGMFSYRDEDNNVDVIQEVDMTSEEDGLAVTHWSQEKTKWRDELERWQKLKEAQRIYHQIGRSETDLELENTDVGLVEVLSKLVDWQDFQFIQQKKVHEAERLHEHCQQGVARLQNAMVAARAAESTREIEEPSSGWMRTMGRAQEQLEVAQKELTWVKGQWTEVLAEASDSLAATPKLQKEIEDKVEKQTNTIYHRLQQMGARPSHTVHPPKTRVFRERLQHWISESSAFTAEVWQWRIFMSWRRYVKNVDTMKQQGQKQPSEVDSSSELFEDHVEYCQYKVDKATSWVDCWRSHARQCADGNRTTSLPERKEQKRGPFYPENSEDDDGYEEARALAYAKTSFTEADQAEIYAKDAEERVLEAKKRLEQSKRVLESVLAQCCQPSTGDILAEDLEAQLAPTPPQSQSPERLPKNRRPSSKRSPAEKGRRGLKKEHARKRGANISTTNVIQQPLPEFSLGPNLVEEDDDIEMSDVLEGPRSVEATEELEESESEDTVMSDAEEPPNHTPPSSSNSHSRPTTNTTPKKLRPPSAQDPTSRKMRSATKLGQAPSGKVLKNVGKKPAKKNKTFTEQQTAALLKAASTSNPSNSNPDTPLRRSERLKEKAEASIIPSPPQLNAIGSSRSSRQKEPKKLQPNDTESSQTSKPKKTKIQRDAVELRYDTPSRKGSSVKKGASKRREEQHMA